MHRTAVIGLGYWGLKLFRNLVECPGFQVRRICDHHEENLAQGRKLLANVICDTQPDAIWTDNEIDLVVIATQAQSHFDLMKKALEAGKHVLVEKPFTQTLAEAKEALSLATSRNRRVFVDHTYIFSSEFEAFRNAIRFQIASPGLYQSQRSDYGKFPKDCGVVSHLLYHDLYVLDEMFGLNHLTLQFAREQQLISPYFPDWAVLHFSNEKQSFVLRADLVTAEKVRHISWTAAEQTVIWDDLKKEKLVRHRAGVVDRLAISPSSEPLRRMIEHTRDHLASGTEAAHEGKRALNVMKMIASIDHVIARERRAA